VKLSVADAAPVTYPKPPESGVVPTAPGRRIGRRRLAVLLDEPGFDIPSGDGFPRTRAECVDAERPCPWIRCRHHLYLEVAPGGLVVNFPDRELEDLPDTCALDVAARGDHTLEEVAQRLNVTRERVRQIEVTALAKLRLPALTRGLAEEGRQVVRDWARFADEDLDEP
jgi:hypothetical protein